MKKKTFNSIILLFAVFFAVILSSLTLISVDVSGLNKTNDTSVAKVWVWNTEPTLYGVEIFPSSIDLNPGNTTVVNCTGYVWDYNGWQDVNFTDAVFYHESSSNGATDDNNYHYTSTNCNCTQYENSLTNASCSCLFDVEYYAYNGTWTCNMTIHDDGGNATERLHIFNSTNNNTAQVNTVLGIDVPAIIDYGNLSVTEISEIIPVNVTNWGNVPINISVKGYGGTNDTIPGVGNWSMLCDYGNITIDNERYSVNSTDEWATMTNLSQNWTGVIPFHLPWRESDASYTNDTNTTYWRLAIPLSVGGYCNGTVEFLAAETEKWW